MRSRSYAACQVLTGLSSRVSRNESQNHHVCHAETSPQTRHTDFPNANRPSIVSPKNMDEDRLRYYALIFEIHALLTKKSPTPTQILGSTSLFGPYLHRG